MQTKSLVAFLSLAVCSAASARAQTLEWIQQLDSGGQDGGTGVSADGLGNVYMSGWTNGILGRHNVGGMDAFISKYNASGTLQWTEQLGTSEDDGAYGVSADGLGNVYISGQIGNDWVTGYGRIGDAFVAKYDASGAHQWTRQLDISSSDSANGVSADGLGNVYISVRAQVWSGGNRGEVDSFLAKYDASGNLLWTEQLGTSEWGGFCGVKDVSADGLGNVYISGITDGSLGGINAGGTDAYLANYDAGGNLQWIEQLGTSSNDHVRGVSADGLGNVYISGYTYGSLGGPNAGVTDAFVSKYDASGNLQWTEQLGTSEVDGSTGVFADGLGNVYISGQTTGSLGGPHAGEFDAFVASYDASGTLQWTRQIGSREIDWECPVSADGLGNVYISGVTNGILPGIMPHPLNNGDAFLVKFVDLSVLAADFDGDGDVDGDDFIRWQIGFGEFSNGGAQKSDGDYDNDGDVDGDDFLGWQAEFGSVGNAAAVAVPEPSSILLLLAALSLSLTRSILRNGARARSR